MSAAAAITGLGLHLCGPSDVPDAARMAIEVVGQACREAGIDIADLDGLLVNRNELIADDHLSLDLARTGGFGRLRALYELESKGTTFAVLVEQAVRLVEAGRARHVAVVFADAAIVPGRPAGAAFASMGGDEGYRGLERANGMLGAVAAYALLADSFFAERGGSADDLYAVASTQRQWASLNPLARARSPLAREEYLESPLVATPLRRLDCARPVSGAAAVVVSRPRGDASVPPVHLCGSAQRYAARRRHAPGSTWRPDGAKDAFDEARDQAGWSTADLDLVQIYDPFTVVPLILLEELGLVDQGKAGAWYADGNAGPGGALPVNTGGGQISGFYLQGVTPVVEAVTQLRGTAGDRQVDGARRAAVVAIGGRLEGHATLCLGTDS
ncbi:MAG: putative thiolase [Nocardioidaceae bacterium]|nr:putative thiolase [Nocardioidaceae bacterium]